MDLIDVFGLPHLYMVFYQGIDLYRINLRELCAVIFSWGMIMRLLHTTLLKSSVCLGVKGLCLKQHCIES